MYSWRLSFTKRGKLKSIARRNVKPASNWSPIPRTLKSENLTKVEMFYTQLKQISLGIEFSCREISCEEIVILFLLGVVAIQQYNILQMAIHNILYFSTYCILIKVLQHSPKTIRYNQNLKNF